jgi:hypothetical protein
MEQQQFTFRYPSFLLLNLDYYSVIYSAHSKIPKDIYLMACLLPLNADVVFDL